MRNENMSSGVAERLKVCTCAQRDTEDDEDTSACLHVRMGSFGLWSYMNLTTLLQSDL